MNVVKDLWNDKPLFITVVVGLAAVAFILYKQNSATLVAPSTASTDATGASVGQAVTGLGTLVEESYYNNVVSTITNSYSTPVASPVHTAPPSGKPHTEPKIIGPLPKGKSLSGNHDTNWWTYTVPPGQTLLSISRNVAKWGTNTQNLVNYRNNKQILQAAKVDINNPLATVPTGLQISV